MINLKGHGALVTGGSKGIGKAIALALAQAGANVVITSRHAKEAMNTLRQLRRKSVKAEYIQSDLSVLENTRRVVTEAFQFFPKLDILVNNAGTFCDKDFLENTPAEWDRLVNLNLRGMYFTSQTFARRLIAMKRPGKIIMVGSTNSFVAEENSTIYDTTKGGIAMMVKSLAVTLAKHRIHVNGIAPGLIYTPLTAYLQNPKFKLIRQNYERTIPLGRIGRPEDCGGAVVFLASGLADYVTGQFIVIDGGLISTQIGPPAS